MKSVVFYSWQSDLPNSTNRGFIEGALEKAAKTIRDDGTIEVEPVVDRDAKGVAGSPNIAETIFTKIDDAAVFVCDVSLINLNAQARPTPNPNVLIELGYAVKSIGWDRVIMVLNLNYGVPEQLPFDLRMRRIVSYKMVEVCDDRGPERKTLTSELEAALRAIFSDAESAPSEIIEATIPLSVQVRDAIEAKKLSQVNLIGRYMTALANDLELIAPKFTAGCDRSQLLLDSLAASESKVIEFCSVAEIVAVSDSMQAAVALYTGFEEILSYYYISKTFHGKQFHTLDFDFYKFIGQEMFVSFFAFLIRDKKWQLIDDLLYREFYIKNPDDGQSGMRSYEYISDLVETLNNQNNVQKFQKSSPHSYIINERHSRGGISNAVNCDYYMAADLYLFLRSYFKNTYHSNDWIPWSVIYLNETPRFLLEASRRSEAAYLLKSWGLKDSDEFKLKFQEAFKFLSHSFNHSVSSWFFRRYDLNTFASQ